MGCAMTELVPFFHEDWIAWRHVPALTLGEAACLLQGHDPMKARSNRVLPSDVEAMRTALEYALKDGQLEPFEVFAYDEAAGGLLLVPPSEPLRGLVLASQTTVRADSLAKWADARKLEHFWESTTEAQEPARKLKAYPDELRAAIEAFEAVFYDPKATAGKSPRSALLAWLESNKPELGSNARERIATVANWQPAGGAPKTPGG